MPLTQACSGYPMSKKCCRSSASLKANCWHLWLHLKWMILNGKNTTDWFRSWSTTLKVFNSIFITPGWNNLKLACTKWLSLQLLNLSPFQVSSRTMATGFWINCCKLRQDRNSAWTISSTFSIRCTRRWRHIILRRVLSSKLLKHYSNSSELPLSMTCWWGIFNIDSSNI